MELFELNWNFYVKSSSDCPTYKERVGVYRKGSEISGSVFWRARFRYIGWDIKKSKLRDGFLMTEKGYVTFTEKEYKYLSSAVGWLKVGKNMDWRPSFILNILKKKRNWIETFMESNVKFSEKEREYISSRINYKALEGPDYNKVMIIREGSKMKGKKNE